MKNFEILHKTFDLIYNSFVPKISIFTDLTSIFWPAPSSKSSHFRLFFMRQKYPPKLRHNFCPAKSKRAHIFPSLKNAWHTQRPIYCAVSSAGSTYFRPMSYHMA